MTTIAPRPKKPENIAIGARLRRLRVLYGWTQNDIALLVGWVTPAGEANRARVAQLETARVVFDKVDQREAFACAFGLTLDMLNRVLRGEVEPERAHQVGARALAKVAAAKEAERQRQAGTPTAPRVPRHKGAGP